MTTEDAARLLFKSDDHRYATAFRSRWLSRKLDAIEDRDLSGGIGPRGGFLLPTVLWSDILDISRNRGWLGASFMRIEANGSEPIRLPTLDSAIVGRYLHRDAGFSAGDEASFGRTESVGRRLACAAVVSDTLWQSVPNAERLVSEMLADAFGETLERAALVGDGVIEPTGILRDPSIVAIEAVAPGYPLNAANAIHTALRDLPARFSENASVLLNPRTLADIAEALPDRVRWADPIGASTRSTAAIFGRRVIVSDHCPTGEAIVGDLRRGCFVRTPRVAEVSVLRERLAHRGLIELRLEASCDTGAMLPTALRRIVTGGA